MSIRTAHKIGLELSPVLTEAFFLLFTFIFTVVFVLFSLSLPVFVSVPPLDGFSGSVVSPGFSGSVVSPGFSGSVVSPGFSGSVVSPGFSGSVVSPGV